MFSGKKLLESTLWRLKKSKSNNLYSEMNSFDFRFCLSWKQPKIVESILFRNIDLIHLSWRFWNWYSRRNWKWWKGNTTCDMLLDMVKIDTQQSKIIIQDVEEVVELIDNYDKNKGLHCHNKSNKESPK